MQIDLSIIIVEYFSIEDLRHCLRSVEKYLDGLTYEICVCSNSCYREDVRTLLTKRFNNIKWTFSSENLGFAGGVNSALEKATGRAFLLINVDLKLLTPIKPAFDFLFSNEAIGLVGPQIKDKEGCIQDSARKFMTPMILFQRIFKRLFKGKDVILEEDRNYEQSQKVDWVIGAAMLVKSSIVEQVGPMDSNYFLYVEDMDWCKRISDSGAQVHYLTEWKVEYQGDRKSSIAVSHRGIFNKHTLQHIKSYLRYLGKLSRRYSNSLYQRGAKE